MRELSTEARNYLQLILAGEVDRRVDDGRGEEPMPDEWTELYNLTIGL